MSDAARDETAVLHLERIDPTETAGLEKIFGQGKPFLDSRSWLERGREITERVCAIRFGDEPQGTGFLIAPDLVLTCRHVIAAVLDAKSVDSGQLRFVFDHISEGNGKESVELKAHAGEWCVASSEIEDCDFAVIRLERNADRGWIDFTRNAFEFDKHPGLAIIQHPQGEPQKLAILPDEVGIPDEDGRHVRYSTATLAGSSGSPVFAVHGWTLVALHTGYLGGKNRGVAFARIAERTDVMDCVLASFKRAALPVHVPVPVPQPSAKGFELAWAVALVVTILLSSGLVRFGLAGGGRYIPYALGALFGFVVLVMPASNMRVRLGGALLGLVAALGAIREWSAVPDTVAVRLNFFTDDPQVLQPISGLVTVFAGTRAFSERVEQSPTVLIDGIPGRSLGTPLVATILGDFEIDARSKAPNISTDAPIGIRVRARKQTYGCADASFEVLVTDGVAVDFAPEPDQKNLVIELRVVSHAGHPTYLASSMRVAILTATGASSKNYEFQLVQKDPLPANAGADRTLDGLISKEDFALIADGHKVQITAACQNPDVPEDKGPEVTSKPSVLRSAQAVAVTPKNIVTPVATPAKEPTFTCTFQTPVVHAQRQQVVKAPDRNAAKKQCDAICASKAGESCELQ